MQEHGMVPDGSFSQGSLGWRIGTLPEGFYDRVDDGSVALRRCRGSVGFCADGLVVLDDDDDDAVVGADVVILSTGFHIDRPLRDVFASPRFGEMVAPDDGGAAAVLPLYRQCVHPRVPQMAVVGYVESGSSIYPYEMMAKWVAHLLDGAAGCRPSATWSATWRSGRGGAGGRGARAGDSSSSRASPASPRGTTTSSAGTWATGLGGRPASSRSGCSRTAQRTTPASSESCTVLYELLHTKDKGPTSSWATKLLI